MGFVHAVIFCSLLLQSDGKVASRPPGLLPAVQQTPFVPTASIPTTPPITAPPITAPSTLPPPQTDTKQLHFHNCTLIAPNSNCVTLSAPERAVLRTLSTEQRDAAGNVVQDSDGNPMIVPLIEGMNVFKGQMLGKFDDRELHSILTIYQKQLEVAKAEKDKDIEIVYAARGWQVAYADHEAMIEANKRTEKAVPATEMRRAALVLAQAEANLDLQKYNLAEIKTREVDVQESKLEQIKVQIERQQLVSPIDGMIVKINAAEGELLREGHEVLHILQLDTLRVQVRVNVKEYEPSDLSGKQAVIYVTLANGRTETFQGTVVFCDPRVDSGQTFWAYIEIQNRRVGNFWLLQPGRDGVEVVISL